MLEYIDGGLLAEMFVAGSHSLESQKEWINELNVFPVPDGDTGTNMTLTVMSAVKDLSDLEPTLTSVEEVAKKISIGTLKGARGNSGVIMSQLCRGFSKDLGGVARLDKKIIAQAMDKAVAVAYKAVMKPKEGTILTVARCAAEKAAELAATDISMNEFFSGILDCAEETLAFTPELLPVLKEAGVVDSGGQGLVEFFKGALAAYRGEPVSRACDDTPSADANPQSSRNIAADTESQCGYSVEFSIILDNAEKFISSGKSEFKAYLESVGNSVTVISADNIVKVKLKAEDPGPAVSAAIKYGQLAEIAILNLKVECGQAASSSNSESLSSLAKAADSPAAPRNEFGFVSVCAGEGITEVFKSLNVDCVIEGGQTMNPSTEDIAAAINKVNADNVFVLPNNGNVIMTARQAGMLCEDKSVCVIPTKTIPQGISAIMGYVPTLDAEGNEMSMNESAALVKTLEVTHSIRDAEIDNFKIKKGDYMAIGDDGILAVNKKPDKAVIEGVMAMVDEDTALVTIYYGENTKEKHANALSEIIAMKLPDADVEVVYGGQPVYNYIVSAE